MDGAQLRWICCYLNQNSHIPPVLPFASELVQHVYKGPSLLPAKGKMAYLGLPHSLSTFGQFHNAYAVNAYFS